MRMNVAGSLFLLLAVAGANARAASVEARSVAIETPGGRAMPVSIASGVEPGEFVATSSTGARVPVTVAQTQAWMVIPAEVPAGSHTFTIGEAPAGEPRVKLVKHDDADAVDVLIDGELFTTYRYSNEERKPYLWPVKSAGGVSVTRDWPMGEREETGDHPHHVSFWTGYGDIDGNDYWEYGDRTGWQRTESIDFGSGGACGWIATHIVWEDKDHQPVIDEHRTYRFYATSSSERLFDVDVRFAAAHGAVKFGDTKEGGIVSVRMADGLRERGGTGTITNSEGLTGGEAAWGKPAAWCDYSGTIEGAGAAGITVMDHPSSFRYPTHWHVRDYGLMGANPFGYSHFYHGQKNGDHTIEADGTLSFSYRIYVHAGDVTEADVAGHYADFANPPAVRVE